MSHHITWIIDNDPKGKTSRGTLFGCRFKIYKKITNYEYK